MAGDDDGDGTDRNSSSSNSESDRPPPDPALGGGVGRGGRLPDALPFGGGGRRGDVDVPPTIAAPIGSCLGGVDMPLTSAAPDSGRGRRRGRRRRDAATSPASMMFARAAIASMFDWARWRDGGSEVDRFGRGAALGWLPTVRTAGASPEAVAFALAFSARIVAAS